MVGGCSIFLLTDARLWPYRSNDVCFDLGEVPDTVPTVEARERVTFRAYWQRQGRFGVPLNVAFDLGELFDLDEISDIVVKELHCHSRHPEIHSDLSAAGITAMDKILAPILQGSLPSLPNSPLNDPLDVFPEHFIDSLIEKQFIKRDGKRPGGILRVDWAWYGCHDKLLNFGQRFVNLRVSQITQNKSKLGKAAASTTKDDPVYGLGVYSLDGPPWHGCQGLGMGRVVFSAFWPSDCKAPSDYKGRRKCQKTRFIFSDLFDLDELSDLVIGLLQGQPLEFAPEDARILRKRYAPIADTEAALIPELGMGWLRQLPGPSGAEDFDYVLARQFLKRGTDWPEGRHPFGMLNVEWTWYDAKGRSLAKGWCQLLLSRKTSEITSLGSHSQWEWLEDCADGGD